MLFEQIRSTDGTGTLSYLLADDGSGKAVLIDPNTSDIDRIHHSLRLHGMSLEYIVDTHTHADHISAAGELQRAYRTQLIMHDNTRHKWSVVDQGDAFGIGDILRTNAAFEVDRYVSDGDRIDVGSLVLKVLFTPGHTDNHISMVSGDMLFTGDLLLIGQAGRSDLPGGNTEEQYESLVNKILPLPDHTRIFPGHDYEGREFAYLGDERQSNPFLRAKSKEDFVGFVKEFFPPLAQMTGDGRMTLQCGTARVAEKGSGITDLTPEELSEQIQGTDPPFLLDVREPFELSAFGAIPHVRNISIRELSRRTTELPRDVATRIVVVCQTGNRSVEAAHFLVREGYNRVGNLLGGTSAWRGKGLPLEHSFSSVQK